MSNIIKLLRYEEGWREKPYVDTEGYPTVGYGFKLGPKLQGNKYQQRAECMRIYDFKLPQAAGDAWLLSYIDKLVDDMAQVRHILSALDAAAPAGDYTHNPRSCVLISMAYQMGVGGLAGFRNTLMRVTNQDWFQAETSMLKSKWASQTPNRARRHARMMRSGLWLPEYL